jgi:hypothetical protein
LWAREPQERQPSAGSDALEIQLDAGLLIALIALQSLL